MPFFSLYINIHGLQKGPGKFFMGSWKSPGFFLSVKEWEPCPKKNLNRKILLLMISPY